jgi:putative SOS response-associated peptidase YedK
MCGRIIRKTGRYFIAQDLGMDDDIGPDLPPRYNIPPGGPVLALRQNSAGLRELVYLRWGLIPSWAKEERIAFKMINARAETLLEKPAFRDAFRKRRCLIPVDGFYEWQKTGEGKNPFFIRLRDERPFLLAGLWERWASPAAEPIESCTVITTRANDLLLPIHDRMPVIIASDEIDFWLDPGRLDVEVLLPLLTPFPAGEMVATRVSRRVNNPKSDDPACLVAA